MPTRDERLHAHLFKKLQNLEILKQEQFVRHNSELSFKPQITAYTPTASAPSTKRDPIPPNPTFKPLINKKSELILQTLTRKTNVVDRLYVPANV